jgi:DNA-binding GntR family transcriptional regulator
MRTAAVRKPAPASGREVRLPLGLPIAPGAGRSMREEAHARLRDAIMGVRLLPGQAVSENEIVDMLQVSRTPVREALQRLANEGLIHVVPQVGTFVARMDLARIREALFMREAIECAALARIPAKLDKGSLESLQATVADHRRGIRNANRPLVFEADDAFHRALLDLAGVPGVWRYVREAREMHGRIRALSHTEYDSARRSAAQHAAVIAELAAGRKAGAIDILREHIRMNAGFAEDMARLHPDYFIDGRNAPRRSAT